MTGANQEALHDKAVDWLGSEPLFASLSSVKILFNPV
jgi:hypothetical protein